jgi:hypothetical protein
MQLTDEERAMADGSDGPAVARAMDLLQRYGRALGAECLVATNNIVASVTASTPFNRDFARTQGGMDAVFSEFSLDSAVAVPIPRIRAFTTHTQPALRPTSPRCMGVDEATVRSIATTRPTSPTGRAGHQHLHALPGGQPATRASTAWMESSAVVYCNSVLGARTNTEGRESVGAAMLTGRIPYWGYHLDANRRGTHHIRLQTPVESTSDWGLLGYWIGDQVQERVPVVSGVGALPNLARLKHFGAAASSSRRRCTTWWASRPWLPRWRRPWAAPRRRRCWTSDWPRCAPPGRRSTPPAATPRSTT